MIDRLVISKKPDAGDFPEQRLAWDILKTAGAHRVPDEIDLSACTHLKPYSIACLCSIGALARVKGREVRALPPVDRGCLQHLARLGLFDWLSCPECTDVGERPTNLPAQQVRWPPGHIAEEAIGVLTSLMSLPAGLTPRLVVNLSEVITNALSHAESPIDCIVVGQGFPKTDKVDVAVLDLGLTIKGHLSRNPEYEGIGSHEKAIMLATEEGVTGTPAGKRNPRGDPNSGVGLYELRSYCERGHGELTILSGDCFVTFKGDQAPVIGRLYGPGFRGCLVNIRFFTKTGLSEFAEEPIL